MLAWLPAEGAKRRAVLAALVYVLTTAVYCSFAAPETLALHTPYNHFALQAEAWLHGRTDLGGPPPAYAHGNDFSLFEGRWFVPFPPLPALLLLPLVAVSGSAAAVADGRVFLFLAGIAPAVLFLALEKLRVRGDSERSERDDLLLTALFAFGSVYFFSAEQGTVWYAAHVVGAGLAALYVWLALGAERPLLAGLCLGLGYATRAPLLFAAPLFVFELWRAVRGERRRFAQGLALFALPIVAVLGATLAYNAVRFGDAFENGYRFLAVAWHARIEKWGLFGYHYLARNLGVMLTSLPWLGNPDAPFRVNGHGLALWVTTPAYLWLLWPKATKAPHWALVVTAGCVALPTLFYQNSGWVQFGYRFSNDYAVFLFALLAVGGRRWGRVFWALALYAVVLNAFGALTFGRPAGANVYVIDGSQRILYEPD
jgi:hypothetical protein